MKEKNIRLFKAMSIDKVREKVDTPISILGQSYKPNYSIPHTFSQFQEDCGLCYAHIYSGYLMNSGSDSISIQYCYSMAERSLNAIYQSQGGMQYAFYLARNQTFGIIQSQIASSLKNEARQTYLNHLFTTYVNPYSYNELKTLMHDYIEYFHIELKRDYDIERMIAEYKTVLMTHIHIAETTEDSNVKHTYF